MPSSAATEPDAQTPPSRCQIAVIGAGIIGLAVARELLERLPRSTLCVFEKERCVGAHQTGHSSGVIHAGIYYKPGSLNPKYFRGTPMRAPRSPLGSRNFV